MTLESYLKHRRRYEILAIGLILVLITATNATSKILENLRRGTEPAWIQSWATELTSIFAVAVLFPLLLLFFRWLNLGFDNLRWRVLYHMPGFLMFSLAHIALFSLARTVLWSLAGYQYQFGPVLLSIVYEMRKDFWTYVAIVAIVYCYGFILTRLQGEARFLAESDGQEEKDHYRQQFLVKMLNREYLVRVEEIDWVQSAGNYVLMACGDRRYPMRQTLKGLEEQLDPVRFLRVHRTAIVNVEQVVSLQEAGESRLELRSGERVPVSKTYLPALRQSLQQEMGAAG